MKNFREPFVIVRESNSEFNSDNNCLWELPVCLLP